MIEQKYVKFSKRTINNQPWLLGESGSPSYLVSQGHGESGLEKDLADGWVIKWLWEDVRYIVFILVRE